MLLTLARRTRPATTNFSLFLCSLWRQFHLSAQRRVDDWSIPITLYPTLLASSIIIYDSYNSTMISCVAWVPQGVADPHPKAYELSAAEKELLEQQADLEEALDNDAEQSEEEKEQVSNTTMNPPLPKIDPNSLPVGNYEWMNTRVMKTIMK